MSYALSIARSLEKSIERANELAMWGVNSSDDRNAELTVQLQHTTNLIIMLRREIEEGENISIAMRAAGVGI